MATYIAVVGTGYTLLLRHIWDPQGLQKVADVLLHDAIPVLYVLFWFIFCRKRKVLSWSDAFSWLILPTAYLIYSMVRGSITGWYPYHFLDPAQVSHTSIFIVIVGFIVAFIIMGLIVIALTRRNSADTLSDTSLR
jgi:apolipoprotein N-acyltransferase